MTQQPDWECIANLGDVNPVDYGGFFVFRDRTGVYPPEAEYLVSAGAATVASVLDRTRAALALAGEE